MTLTFVQYWFQIDIDFNHVYPLKENSLFVKWDQFIVKIIPLKSIEKEENSKSLLKCIIKKKKKK